MAQCLKKDRYHLVRVWPHKKNCKYLKAHHILQHLLDLGGGGGAQVLCLKNKMLSGLFPGNENNYYDSNEKTEKLYL